MTPASLLDDAFHPGLLAEAGTQALLSDEAEVRTMLAVEAALARVQGEVGLIPAEAAEVLASGIEAAKVEPQDLAGGTARDGVPVPALLGLLRARLPPEAARWLHWGATSQDVVDTALMLRLRQLIRHWDGPMRSALRGLARQAAAHAETPMAARTYGQLAVPTSFGAVAAGWGRPLLACRARLAALELPVSLGGAAGTLAAMGPQGPEVRARLAARLGLADPGASWHADRRPVGAVAAALADLLGALGKMGEDVLLLAQSGVGEVRLVGAGGSSTMPQKANPVAPSALVALARHGLGLAGMVQASALHRQGRDGAAWLAERLSLTPLLAAAGGAIRVAGEVAERLEPDPAAMVRNLEAGGGAIHAEALAFALARTIPLQRAQAEVKAMAQQAGDRNLADLVRERHPGLEWTGPDLGQAPAEARAFAAEVAKA